MKQQLTSLLCLGMLVCAQGNEANWYKSWTYRQKITIPAASVTGSHSAFPVLITEHNVQASLFTNALSSGHDIVFTTADAETRIPHEIERYDAGNEQATLWVNVPALADTGDTILYVYYGKAVPSTQEDVANVWTNGFIGVWHLNESSGTRIDSTTADRHATTNGIVSHTADGRIGGAVSLAGTGHLDLPINEAGLGMHTNSFTVSVWYKKGTLTGSHSIVTGESNGGATNYRGFSLYVTSTTLYGWFADEALNRKQLSRGGDTANVWAHGVLLWDKGNDQIRLYRNGDLAGPLDAVGHTVTAVQIDIGAANGGQRFIGSIDEVRISRGVRSADWIATEFANQNAPATFATAAVEERLPYSTQLIIR